MAGKNDFEFDPDLVRALAALLDETGLTEIEYAAGAKRVRVARQHGLAAAATAPLAPVSATQAEEPPTFNLEGAVKAPMVGIVHLSPQPGAPPFVKLGDAVREGQTLFIIEAMKVMNQIPAHRAGKVAQLLVENGAPVEYGQVLAIIE